MTKNELRKAIEKPGPVFAFVRLTEDDSHLIEIKKTSILAWLEKQDEDEEIIALWNNFGQLLIG